MTRSTKISASLLFLALMLAGPLASGEGAAEPAGEGAAEATGEGAAEAAGEGAAEAAGEELPPGPPAIVGLPGRHLDVSFAQAVEGLRAGERIAAGRDLEIPAGSCLRLLAERAASVALSGPARLRVDERQGRLLLSIVAGRGVLAIGDEGAALQLGEDALLSRGGLVTFDVAADPAVTLVSEGEVWLDGVRLEPVTSRSAAAASELLAADWCAPPRPVLSVPLGDARSLVADMEAARRDAGGAESEEATAESGATCVDSADSGSASSPTTGDGVVIDPDVRRDETGRLRLTIRVPAPR